MTLDKSIRLQPRSRSPRRVSEHTSLHVIRVGHRALSPGCQQVTLRNVNANFCKAKRLHSVASPKSVLGHLQQMAPPGIPLEEEWPEGYKTGRSRVRELWIGPSDRASILFGI